MDESLLLSLLTRKKDSDLLHGYLLAPLSADLGWALKDNRVSVCDRQREKG